MNLFRAIKFKTEKLTRKKTPLKRQESVFSAGPASYRYSEAETWEESTDTSDDYFMSYADERAAIVSVVLSCVIGAWWVTEGKDTRLADLRATQEVLMAAHEQRQKELADLTHQLSELTTTNEELLAFIVTQAEEDTGIQHSTARPPPLHQRLARVNNALQIAKETEKSARFGAGASKSKPRSANYHPDHTTLASWRSPVHPSQSGASKLDFMVKESSFTPKFEVTAPAAPHSRRGDDSGSPAATRNLNASPQRLYAVGVRGADKKAEALAKKLPAERYTIILRHKGWLDDRTAEDSSVWGRRKLKAMSDLLLRKCAVATWLPQRRLKVDVRGVNLGEEQGSGVMDEIGNESMSRMHSVGGIDRYGSVMSTGLSRATAPLLPEVLINALNKGYTVWDENGICLTMTTVDDPDNADRAEQLDDLDPPPQDEHDTSTHPPLIVTVEDPVSSFKTVASALKESGYYVASVTPIAPLTYSLIFRPPAPSPSDLIPICKVHHWKLHCRSIGARAY